MVRLTLLAAALGLASVSAAQTAPTVPTVAVYVYSAGSLRQPLTEMARAFEKIQPEAKIELIFGASGLLKDRIASQAASESKPAHLFTSANMEHPQALSATGRFSAVQRFTSNRLCALAAPRAQEIVGAAINTGNIVAAMRNQRIKLGTSTPVADPSGDYTWQMFERVESSGSAPAGSAAALKARALQLTGGPNSPAPPANRNVYGQLSGDGSADIFITYCTNAAVAQAEVPSLSIVQLPDAVNVAADYGLTLAANAPAAAVAFAQFILAPAGQAQLARAGFAALP